MGQSSLQGNRKATLEIQIAFLASAAAALCDAERSPWVYSGGGSVELVADVSCDLAVCDLPPVSRASATTWLCSPVLSSLSLEPNWPCFSWQVASPLLFRWVWPLVRFPERRSYGPETTHQGQWLNWTDYPDVVHSGPCSVDVDRLCEASSTVSFHVPCKKSALVPLRAVPEGVFPL